MHRRISKELAFYLKKNKLYTKFIGYVRDSNDAFITLTSFNWMTSREGYHFWQAVEYGYSEYLSNKLFGIINNKIKEINGNI